MEPFQSFYFDCDSTLSTIEGVDELTRHLPADEQAALAILTNQAMDGQVALAKVYEERLGRVAPNEAALASVSQRYIDNLVPDCATTIAALRSLGKEVGVVSGGLYQPVRDLATHLAIPTHNVHAVRVLFDEHGQYRDFDRTSPLWKNHGKVEVLKRLPDSHRPLLFVGDGATDLETQGTADLFVGYGGVERRPTVEASADVYLTGASLAGVLKVGLTPSEKNALRSDQRFADLLPIR